ncbi:type I restriction-modification system subunit M [Actinotalea sp. M2MS4P-6]|uniref:type I restriction-modification system subunit M n=1 Tax=Actinotalea sp. M2MS4P-6 TaxID=2983762 RepID=UPI0021E497AE|nr:type I restriction-modification system subunit M [Actinotalea sp. M2MS4P-6]MCV2393268.1 type I restriction-modification system subunit M [Actinotalea sp. M2MS4P-6]
MTVALKKSDLYSSLWAGADELRGGMDASQYKDYVLTLLFVKYVSDKAKADPNSLVEVPQGGSFDDLVSFRGQSDIGDKVNKAIRKLADVNDLVGVINNADFDDPNKLGEGKALVDRLSKLIGIFQDLDFSGSRAEGDDLLGDAYEYLMQHFATESGKSKGQFYTPAEVSRVMAQLIGITPSTPKSATVYDPTCGSGSLLLKVADAAPHGLTIYGQEKDNATWALAKMNMILHGNETADVRQGDTLVDPKFRDGDRLETFDFLVANPPFSVKSWTNGLENEYGRFDGYGRPPEKNGDYAFLLHMVTSLKSTGKGAVILPHGVLFRGNAEASIRKALIRKGYVKGIIGLPANLFYGTGIPACIIVLDKENAQARTGVFMIDASKGFVKDGNKNRLRPRDMHQIIDVFNKHTEVERYSRMVPVAEIGDPRNDYNLNIPRYIDSSEPEDIQDLHAHLRGGIPDRDLDALQRYWDAFPSLRGTLFKPLRPGYSEFAAEKSEIQVTITSSPEYEAFANTTTSTVTHWWNVHRDELVEISSSTRPNTLIALLGDTLLERFRPRPLIDEYGVYEQLVSYWNETMHDDVALIMSDGWDEAAKPRKAIENKERKLSETPDLVVGAGRSATKYKTDLIPPALIVDRYFADEKAKLEELNAAAEAAGQAVEEFIEQNSGEEGLLADTMDDDKISKALAAARLKAAKREDPKSDEVRALAKLIALYDAEASAKKAARDAQVKLDEATLKQYGRLSTEEILELVIDDKWGARFVRGAQAELQVLIRQLVDRLNVLGDRYAETVGDLDAEVERLSDKVAEHLSAMGVRF